MSDEKDLEYYKQLAKDENEDVKFLDGELAEERRTSGYYWVEWQKTIAEVKTLRNALKVVTVCLALVTFLSTISFLLR